MIFNLEIHLALQTCINRNSTSEIESTFLGWDCLLKNTSRFSKTERSLEKSNLKGMSNNARLRSVSRPKGAKGLFKRRGRGNHLQHRLLTDTAKSSQNSKAHSSTSNEDCTLCDTANVKSYHTTIHMPCIISPNIKLIHNLTHIL